MAEPMTPEGMDALEALANEATEGPWNWVVHDVSMATLGVLPDPGLGDPHVLSIGPCEACCKRAKPQEWKWGRCHVPGESDAKLIAQARTAVPALIATVREAWADRDKWFDKLLVEQGMTAMYKTAEERALDWNSQAKIRAEQAEDRAEKAEAELAEAREGRDEWQKLTGEQHQWQYEVEKKLVIAEAELAKAREALRQILGWRERDRKDMADVIKFIEDTARAALNPEKADG